MDKQIINFFSGLSQYKALTAQVHKTVSDQNTFYYLEEISTRRWVAQFVIEVIKSKNSILRMREPGSKFSICFQNS